MTAEERSHEGSRLGLLSWEKNEWGNFAIWSAVFKLDRFSSYRRKLVCPQPHHWYCSKSLVLSGESEANSSLPSLYNNPSRYCRFGSSSGDFSSCSFKLEKIGVCCVQV